MGTCSNVQGHWKHAKVDRDYEIVKSTCQVAGGVKGDARDESRDDEGERPLLCRL